MKSDQLDYLMYCKLQYKSNFKTFHLGIVSVTVTCTTVTSSFIIKLNIFVSCHIFNSLCSCKICCVYI